MGVSKKYRTFRQLMEDVSIDFSNNALEGMPCPLVGLKKNGITFDIKHLKTSIDRQVLTH